MIAVDPTLTAVQGARLDCPSGSFEAVRAGDTIRFPSVPEERCTVSFAGDPARAGISGGGAWRLAPSSGGSTLVPDR